MSLERKTIDQIDAELTTLDGTERNAGRNNTGDFRITWSNIRAWLKTYFDTQYPTDAEVATIADTQITATIASEAEAIAGTSNVKLLTPLRLRNGLNASGSAPIYACRAWVNFNGTGTVAIIGSGNVSSITDLDTGQYTVNFTSNLPDAYYSVVTNSYRETTWVSSGSESYDRAVSNFKMLIIENNIAADSSIIDAVVFR